MDAIFDLLYILGQKCQNQIISIVFYFQNKCRNIK